eukprot:4529247-Prymnesium_polylepis.1
MARDRIEALWPWLSPLCVAPWRLTAPQLLSLTEGLFSCRFIGDDGLRTLVNASAVGAMAKLTELHLGGNQIGYEGMKTFTDATSRGALANLKKLSLINNEIADEGMKALASAIAMGAL